MKLEINIVKMHLVLLVISIFLVAGIGIVVGYGTSVPSNLGHSVGELDFTGGFTVPSGNVDIGSGDLSIGSGDLSIGGHVCIKDQSGCKYLNPMVFEVADLAEHSVRKDCALNVDLEEYCGDFDGCTIRVVAQHETQENDQVHVIEEHIYMENPDFSNNKKPNTLYGWTRQGGGGDYSWITGDTTRHEIFSPWDWVWMLDYKHSDCEGVSAHEVYTDPYTFTFMTARTVSARFLIYD